MSKLDSLFAQALLRADTARTRRHLRPAGPAPAGRIELGGKQLLNFSSNDYLGLARHPALAERAAAWAREYGSGAQASRLVSGNLDLHVQVEAKLARAKGTEAALLFASGWQTNAAVLPALLAAAARLGEPQVYADKLNHASLHHGCQAAGVRQIRFRHNDLDHLEALLTARADQPGARFIVTESVFSMDGDRSDVARLAQLAERHDAFLYLDEAHATGVLGPNGMGLASLAPRGVDLAMGTFSKALGGFGAYVAGSRVLCDYLVNACSGFIYTTALPPSVLGAMDAALDLVPQLDAERARLAASGVRVRQALAELGLDTGNSSTQIVPAVVGGAGRALALSEAMQARGVLAVAIRPPTVAAGFSRLRIALSAAHDAADLDLLIGALDESLRALPDEGGGA
jgi:8-amino-7-oxononanoate synthase